MFYDSLLVSYNNDGLSTGEREDLNPIDSVLSDMRFEEKCRRNYRNAQKARERREMHISGVVVEAGVVELITNS